jgi:cyclic beta-1,2-glucan synthetase
MWSISNRMTRPPPLGRMCLQTKTFGSIVTEAGLGWTWATNSGENRLTPWSNDPVAIHKPRRLYLRDEETARLWTPTPQPAGNGTHAGSAMAPATRFGRSRARASSRNFCVFVSRE